MDKKQDFLEQLTGASEQTNVDATFGEPQELHGHIMIPIAEIIYGLGGGFGTTEGESAETEAGGQAGARTRPLAYIDVGPEGTQIQPIRDEQKIALAGLLLTAWICTWIGLTLRVIFHQK